jgi:hypothetical protein
LTCSTCPAIRPQLLSGVQQALQGGQEPNLLLLEHTLLAIAHDVALGMAHMHAQVCDSRL